MAFIIFIAILSLVFSGMITFTDGIIKQSLFSIVQGIILVFCGFLLLILAL